MRMRVLAMVALCVALLVPSADAASGPTLETPTKKLRASLSCPKRFTDRKHEPVLLVHGTFVNGDINWSWNYVPRLSELGYDVCTVDYANNGLDDIQVSSEYIVFAVREIAMRSGDKVDVLGVSQGGLELRWAVKWWPDVRASVDDLVMFVSPNHGTYAQPRPPFQCFPSCWQMGSGSKFLAVLNTGDETPGTISYTSIYTLVDPLVNQYPTPTSPLRGARNVLIQDLCPGRPTDHATITADAVAYALAMDAFTHPGPASLRRFDQATCMQSSMPGTRYEEGFDATLAEIGRGGPTWTFTGEEPPLKRYARRR